ncbi:hypothetical protein C8R45DRAFT_1000982 [Mycena sanguinolenta]|nr:hypothetical protein C8R45DRAFT_1000982 [Mycena sanguinolenta]
MRIHCPLDLTRDINRSHGFKIRVASRRRRCIKSAPHPRTCSKPTDKVYAPLVAMLLIATTLLFFTVALGAGPVSYPCGRPNVNDVCMYTHSCHFFHFICLTPFPHAFQAHPTGLAAVETVATSVCLPMFTAFLPRRSDPAWMPNAYYGAAPWKFLGSSRRYMHSERRRFNHELSR